MKALQDQQQKNQQNQQNQQPTTNHSNLNTTTISTTFDYTKTNIENNEHQTSTSSSSSSSSSFDTFAFKAFGVCTNGTYTIKSKSNSSFVLFINNRLVESPSIKRSMEEIYHDTLPRGSKPFIYLSLILPGVHVDVNVHPTKRQVAILFEEKLCTVLAEAMRNLLRSVNTSRTC